jgi:very-short-patch-repair endonuclease
MMLFLPSPICVLPNGGGGRRPEGVSVHKRTTPKIFHRARELRHNKTPEEEKLWSRLRGHQMDGVGFRPQHAIGDTIVDFCAPRKKLVIELDGSQHLESVESDTERTAFLKLKGYKVIRFFNYEINENIEDVLRRIRIANGKTE